MKVNWNFQTRGEGDFLQKPFCGGGMDILWNYTIFMIVIRVKQICTLSYYPEVFCFPALG